MDRSPMVTAPPTTAQRPEDPPARLPDASGSHDHPSRRGVLLLLGAGAMAPAAVAALGAVPRGSEADGLRFDVLGVTRSAVAGHARHTDAVPRFEAMSWPDVVRVRLRVRNVGGLPLLLSPGQFRLRVDGLSVMPTAWRHAAAALAAGDSRTGWVDYRAPARAGVAVLEFTPAGRTEPVAVPLAVPAEPSTAARAVASGGAVS